MSEMILDENEYNRIIGKLKEKDAEIARLYAVMKAKVTAVIEARISELEGMSSRNADLTPSQRRERIAELRHLIDSSKK